MPEIKWPADQVTRRPLDGLTPYARNARTHSEEQIGQIAASIQEWGWTMPVLVDEAGGIIAGHGRVLAAQRLGLADIPVIEAKGWSEAKKRAYVLADNKLALNAGWDDELLRLELGELQFAGFDLDLTGFTGAELASYLAARTDGLTDPDEVPEAPAEPATLPGDVWVLGRHRLICGDATNADDVAKLAYGCLADLCFTSPPYLRQRDYEAGIDDWDALMQGVFSVLPVKNDAQLLVNLGMVHRDGEWLPYWDGWISWMREQGWRRFGWYVWDQGPGMPGDWNGRLAPSHEWIFHFNRIAERARKTKEKLPESIALKGGTGMRRRDGTMSGVSSPHTGLQRTKIPDSVIRVARQHGRIAGSDGDHPAVFPVDLVSEILTAFSDPGDVVYEPFCGSGTQLISTEKNGRTCLAMEIAPLYCDVAIQRWQNFTGQQAVLDKDGRSYEAVATARSEAKKVRKGRKSGRSTVQANRRGPKDS